MRPRYESDADRALEREVIARWVRYMGGAVVKEKPLSTFDYRWYPSGMPLGEPPLPIEVKCRGRLYSDLMLSEKKWAALLKAAGILIWSTPQVTLWCSAMPHDDIRIGKGGRCDRGDPYDLEPCVFIPRRHFLEVL
jgi:hypothetical protein